MRNSILCIATAIATLVCAGGVQAQTTLLYDMEGAPPPSGFGANGAVIVTQDTIGTTQGLNSMRVEVPVPPGGTFVGALTSSVPTALQNPGLASYVLYDLTINAGEEYTGAGFADMGVTIFGYQGATFGLQSQFADYESIGAKSAGTYKDIRIDLDNSLHYPGKSLRQLLDDGDFDGVTGFQFYFNQTGDAPVVAYIDNVRLVVPEPATCMLLGMGAVVIGAMGRRRKR
jgi:hypothetical protein